MTSSIMPGIPIPSNPEVATSLPAQSRQDEAQSAAIPAPHASLRDNGLFLVRLPARTTPAAFERRLAARTPSLNGSLLTWTHGDWFALDGASARQLREHGGNLADAVKSAGAAGLRSISAGGLAQMLDTRVLRADASAHLLRDLDTAVPVKVDPPDFSSPSVYRGSAVDIDWHLDAIGVPSAWNMLGARDAALPWTGIRVGHIDTGYTRHPALGFGTPGGTWLKPELGKNYFRDLPAPVPVDGQDHWDDVQEDAGPRDNLTGGHAGHGTRTGSLITGLFMPTRPALRYPFIGVAAGVETIPYRITDSVIIDRVHRFLAQAIRDAVGQNCGVISISLGGLVASRDVADAIDVAYDRGVIVCAAAGQYAGGVIYPGRFNRVVTLGGATTDDGKIMKPWSSASRGPHVDVSGPADRIRRASTVMQGGSERYVVSGGGNGTSFATALCAGVAVLWLAYRRQEIAAKYSGAHAWARAAAFKKLLKQTAARPAQWDNDFGAGIFRADALLAAALPDVADLHYEDAAWNPTDWNA